MPAAEALHEELEIGQRRGFIIFPLLPQQLDDQKGYAGAEQVEIAALDGEGQPPAVIKVNLRGLRYSVLATKS